MIEFENAHCHTYLSNALLGFPDSPSSMEDYVKEYVKRGMQCVVASEHRFRGDVWQQADLAAQYSTDDLKLKPICAAEVYFVPDRNADPVDKRNFHLLLIAKNNAGFYQLNMALSQGEMTGYYRHGRLDFDLLSKLDYRNFLCTTACVGGILKDEHGEEYANVLHDIFKENFRLEVQHHPNNDQTKHNAKVISLYKKYKWPLFFGADTHYVNKEDKILRKELQLSSHINMDDSDWDLYLPTAEEAFSMFEQQGVLSKSQIEEAFENTLELRTFEGFSYTTERKFPISRQELSPEQRSRLYQKLVCDGYIKKEGMPTPEEAKELRSEMNTIIETNSYDYFVGLYDLMKQGIEDGGVLTTTSRGSACGYATNMSLGFTSINRLHSPVKMYPGRFLSKAKLAAGAMPDIDQNVSNPMVFENAGKKIFGIDGCYPMIAFGKTKTSSAFKLLARARNLDFEISNKISKQIQEYEVNKKHAIENNADDPDYIVDEDIVIDDYIEEEYLELVRKSKQYQNIIVSVGPHPCARLVYHKNLKEEIGVIRLKPQAGSTEPRYCVFVDGTTADAIGYCKIDLLKVDVVSIINDTFKAINQPVMTASELSNFVETHPEIWKLYDNGFTIGLNQTEKEATTQKVMQFKPRNTVELSAFVASIRPGAKSLVGDFVARRFHNYGIPAMDNLLRLNGATGITGQSSYLF